MSNSSIIAEGKTTKEAIDNGLKKLNVSKNMVDIKILEDEEKRSFFSILTPRVVKVELTIKDEKVIHPIEKKVEIEYKTLQVAEENIRKFLDEIIPKLPSKNIKYEINIKENFIDVKINGDEINYLIGYRGDTLEAFQNILSAVASKNIEGRVKVLLNIEGYREKREKALEELAEKIAKSVIKTGKTITLEPMSSYERKVIHSTLQNNEKVRTYSKGEEPYRRIVVSLK